MAIVDGSRFIKVKQEFNVAHNDKIIVMGIFSAVVRFGYVLYSGKEAYMPAVVFTHDKHSTVINGGFYDNLQEAAQVALTMLTQEHERSVREYHEGLAKTEELLKRVDDNES